MPVSVISQQLLVDASAEGDSVATPQVFRHLGAVSTKHVIQWAEGVSAGEVTIEEAMKEDYAGSWALVATVTFDGSVTPAPKIDVVNTVASGRAYRHRITGVVVDGTVTTYIAGSE